MIVSHRGVRVPSLRASVVQHTVHHPLFRLSVQERDGVVCDDLAFADAFQSRLDPGRHTLILALEGPVLVRHQGGPDIELSEGEVVVARRDSGWTLRQDRRSFTLLLEVEKHGFGSLRTSSAARIGTGSLGALRVAAAQLVDEAASTPAGDTVKRFLDVLRAEGAPLTRLSATELSRPSPQSEVELVAALDEAVRNISRGPTSLDLEQRLRVGTRQLNRRMRGFHRRHGYNATGGIRDFLLRWRLPLAVYLATAKGATTEGLASQLGYGAAPALCRALAERGLPSAGAIPAWIAQLT